MRGAPAIAIVGCLSLAVELFTQHFNTIDSLIVWIESKLEYLVTARPTAVNMKTARDKLTRFVKMDRSLTVEEVKLNFIDEVERMVAKDIADNKAIGCFGCEHILKNVTEKDVVVLTHCNTGSLATAGYGTALGVVRALHHQDVLKHVYCTETRPYNQGSRLTAYELVHDCIPATLIADSMAAITLKERNVSVVIVGADRIAANGDTANKIGTYQLAISGEQRLGDWKLRALELMIY